MTYPATLITIITNSNTGKQHIYIASTTSSPITIITNFNTGKQHIYSIHHLFTHHHYYKLQHRKTTHVEVIRDVTKLIFKFRSLVWCLEADVGA
ncbi:hypothetical protein HKD37_10G028483 [Glycine soja]